MSVPQEEDAEFNAIRQVYAALKNLDVEAQNRVLEYVSRRLSLIVPNTAAFAHSNDPASMTAEATLVARENPKSEQDGPSEDGLLEGVSPIAQKWIKRNGLTNMHLEPLFSLGVDEIDLVAKSVPGKSKPERVRSVLLLQGIASYLSTGAARVPDEKLREACRHYNAYDATNFSKHLKAVSAEATGSRESGYTLTSRGLAAATEMIKNYSQSN